VWRIMLRAPGSGDENGVNAKFPLTLDGFASKSKFYLKPGFTRHGG
jgi:hypothetical protein